MPIPNIGSMDDQKVGLILRVARRLSGQLRPVCRQEAVRGCMRAYLLPGGKWAPSRPTSAAGRQLSEG